MRHQWDMGAKRGCDKYSEGVEATLAPTRAGRIACLLAAAATLALAAATPLSHELRALAACWVALAAIRALGALGAAHVVRLDAAGEVSVDARAGRISPGSFVAPWLTILRWRPAGARLDRTLLVLPDMLPAEDFRRLRVLLKFGDKWGQTPISDADIGV